MGVSSFGIDMECSLWEKAGSEQSRIQLKQCKREVWKCNHIQVYVENREIEL